MVTFEIECKTSNKITYKYFPENDKKCEFGIFSILIDTGEAIIDKIAEKDFLRSTSSEELNYLRDAINKSRIENGETILSEEELPLATKDEEWYYYADHAIQKVKDELKKV